MSSVTMVQVTGSAHAEPRGSEPLALEHVSCCLCGRTGGDPLAVGEDFEYRSSPDSFLAVRCPDCELVYLDPRPTAAELGRIYPDDYHAFAFSAENFGLAYRVRAWLETRRLLRTASSVPPRGRILDVGCGDGFHLELLRRSGDPSWTLQGVDVDERAVAAARARGLDVVAATIETAELVDDYDLVLMIATIEHVGDPVAVLRAVARRLAPGGRVLIVTDNTDTLDARLSGSRHWGGYHFPRHWNLFNRRSLRRLAAAAGLDVVESSTICSPVNWTYSVRNALDDWGAPRRLVEQFSLSSPLPLAVFTVVDAVQVLLGRGALLRVVLQRPADAADEGAAGDAGDGAGITGARPEPPQELQDPQDPQQTTGAER